MMKMFLSFILGLYALCCCAGESTTNIQKNVVNVKDGSSEANSGISLNNSGEKYVIGNGRIVSRRIKTATFSGIKATGSFVLDIKCGANKPSVVVKADSNLINLIDFKEKDGVLGIAFKQHISTGNPVKIAVSTGNFSMIDLSGSCQAKISDIKSGNLQVSLTGSCRTDLAGKGVKELRAALDGACTMNASKLTSENNFIRLGGSSEAVIRSDGRIEVKADGASELKYIGEPKIKQELNGAASVSKG